jgi:hypothetical protein
MSSGFLRLQVAADGARGGTGDPCARVFAAGGGAGRCGQRVVPRHVRAWPATVPQPCSGFSCMAQPCLAPQARVLDASTFERGWRKAAAHASCSTSAGLWTCDWQLQPLTWMRCAVQVPAQTQGSGAGQPARHGGRGAGRQRAGGAVPRQAEHRAVARGRACVICSPASLQKPWGSLGATPCTPSRWQACLASCSDSSAAHIWRCAR